MKIKVQMLAFCEPGTIREVDIPQNEVTSTNILDLVFKYGQNDFQPQKCPSVSVGDIIELGNDLFVVCPFGFHKVTNEEYTKFLMLDRRDRSFATYEFKGD